MTIDQPSFFSDRDLAAELAVARHTVDRLLADVSAFAVIAHASPWRALDDLLGELRAAATTVAVLEGLQARAPR